MKHFGLLKSIINISFLIVLLKFIISLFLYTYFLFGGRAKFRSINFLGESLLEESFLSTIIIYTFELLINGLFLYTLYIIKKLIKSFSTGSLYSRLQISGLKLAGKLIIVVTITEAVVKFFTTAFADSKLAINLSFNEKFGSFWLIIAIGLFFIYMGKIFANSARIKKENDLTI